MSDRGSSFLDRYTGRTQDSREPDLSVEDQIDGLSFGFLRGVRDRALMLELRKASGNALAVNYGHIEKVEFDPSAGITIHLGRQKIVIKGRNLNAEARPHVRLFAGITRHRVPWIQEADESTALQVGDGAPVIESIEF